MAARKRVRPTNSRPKRKTQPRLSIKYVSIETLCPSSANPRRHPDKQIALIAANINRHGFNVPILIDQHGNVLSGNARMLAALSLGQTTVPTVCLDHLSDAQKRAFILAENRLSELADWDRDVLHKELQHLMNVELDFEVEITGFDTIDIDNLEISIEGDPEDDNEDIPQPEQLAITRPGQMWLLGDHRLVCGDARDPANYARVLDGNQAQMVFTDPPYNVVIGHNASPSARHREFEMASGEMSPKDFVEFLESFLSCTTAACLDGAIIFTCMDWRHDHLLKQAAEGIGLVHCPSSYKLEQSAA
ncbi:MAG: site-specific DNA-methyltransferase [Rhodospirillaceae bacterium]|nr:site-specific DNA-methyltransferase [Rhodospirillaceae bacterium]